MPTYRFSCDKCGGGTEQWLSIHHDASERPTEHADCGGTLLLTITGVRTYGVGERGAATRDADAMDARIDEARPSYKRMRDAGLQPTSVMASPFLERHGDDPMYVESGGQVAVPEHRRDEIREMMSEAKHSDWDPVGAVHDQRGT